MKPFQITGRKGWHAEVRLAGGRKARRTFATEEEASRWMAEGAPAKPQDAPAPAFGGPSCIRLGTLLFEYAKLFSIQKGGCQAELTRINHYLDGANLPQLVLDVDALGRRTLKTKPAHGAVPKGWKNYLAQRQQRSARTFACMRSLSSKLCSEVKTEDITALQARMVSDGLAPSTVQKEVALLKHVFNMAIEVWKWKGFENPCRGVKLSGSSKRFVAVTEAQMQALVRALEQCDNPLVWPLVELAISSAMRKGSLLKLAWSKVDLDGRKARIWGKGRWVDVPLSQRSVEILRNSPRLDSELVFPMTSNALDMAWKGVRERAGLPSLQFRDLRHLAPTMYARRGATATTIMRLLGHTSTRMAQFYIDMNADDTVNELDRLDAAQPQRAQALPPVHDPQGPKKRPRARKAARGESLPPEATTQCVDVNEVNEARSQRAQSRQGDQSDLVHSSGEQAASNLVYLHRPTQRAA